MATKNQFAQLIVEGNNDKHVIWALCVKHHIEQTFEVETPDSNNGGVEKLINSLPVRLKIPRLKALGIVLDANQNLEGRWRSVRNQLKIEGYDALPAQPNPDGTIIINPEKPKVGVWIMPNNQLPGLLEDFVAELIPKDDKLAVKAEAILKEIEHENLHRYTLSSRPKAFIHTWLAWQKIPGQPMGQAITTHALTHNAPLANSFVDWLRNLFTTE